MRIMRARDDSRHAEGFLMQLQHRAATRKSREPNFSLAVVFGIEENGLLNDARSEKQRIQNLRIEQAIRLRGTRPVTKTLDIVLQLNLQTRDKTKHQQSPTPESQWLLHRDRLESVRDVGPPCHTRKRGDLQSTSCQNAKVTVPQAANTITHPEQVQSSDNPKYSVEIESPRNETNSNPTSEHL